MISSLRIQETRCNFLGLADGKQSLVEDPDYRVVPSGYQFSHVKPRLHLRCAAPYNAFASHSSAVSVDGRHFDEGSYLPTVQCAQLLQKCWSD